VNEWSGGGAKCKQLATSTKKVVCLVKSSDGSIDQIIELSESVDVEKSTADSKRVSIKKWRC
jgi:hypothetical protein